MRTLMLLALAALPSAVQDKKEEGPCDQVHGVGCIARGTACEGCRGRAVLDGKLCEACAAARKACSMCGRVKRVHAAVADVEGADGEVRLVCAVDPYEAEVAVVRKSGVFAHAIRDREDGRVSCAVAAAPAPLEAGKRVFVRFAKVDSAGGPPGKYESGILSRRVRVESVLPMEGELLVRATAPRALNPREPRLRALEAACAKCGIAEARAIDAGAFMDGAVVRLPALASDHGFRVEVVGRDGKTIGKPAGPFLLKDGAWTLGGKAVTSPFAFPASE